MKIVIDIPENIYDTIMDDQMLSREQEAVLHHHIYFDGKPLPKGHGRLLDADKITGELLTIDSNYACMADWCLQIIDAQPTIIEADKEAENGKEIQ